MIHVYHPNKASKGYAASFWQSEKDNTVFATIIRQSGWDAQRQVGIFKDNIENPEGKVNIKLNDFEVGAILDCIERGRPFTTFHDHDNTPKSINFTPWVDQSGNSRGYSFTITVTSKQDSAYKNAFFIGLTYAEARVIREFLIFALHKSFRRLAPAQIKPTPRPPVPVEENGPDDVEGAIEPAEDILNF
jgi:hypothetical protein